MDKQQVIDHFGGVREVAEALDVSVQAIYKWPPRVPLLRAYQIERLTGGALKADDAEPAPAE